MLADKIPHKDELKLIKKLLDDEKWIYDIENHDVLDAVDQVSVEIHRYGGVVKTANIYGKLLSNKGDQKKSIEVY